MVQHLARRATFWFLSAFIAASAVGQDQDFDPVAEDLPVVDYDHPATALETCRQNLLCNKTPAMK